MKIGLVVYGSLDRRSGGFLYDRVLANGLEARGHTVRLLSQPEGIYAHQLLRGTSPDPAILAAVDELDILLEDELNHPSLLGTNRAIRKRGGFRAHPNGARDKTQPSPGCRLVGIVHHLRSDEALSPINRWISRNAERWFLGQLDGAIYNSKTTAVSVARGAPGISIPSVVAPPGVVTNAGDRCRPNAASLPAGALQPGALRLLFVGNVIPRKGLLELIGALGQLKPEERRRAQLTVAGGLEADPGYVHRVRAAVDRLGGEGGVHILGRVNDDELRDLYRTHDVLAAPSHYEGYGMVYAEAQHHGLAVLAGRGGAGPEVVVEGKTGFLVDPRRPRTILQALERFLEEPALVRRMGQAGMAAPVQRWEDTVEAVETFLLELI